MKRKVLAACFCISIFLLAGCEKTPEETIVREKNAGNVKNYKSGEESKNSLRERLAAPKNYKNLKTYEDGKLVIDTDANVIVPDANEVNTYAVSAMELDQDLIDTVTNAFFEGDKIYMGYLYSIQTKEDLQEKITLLKKYKAQGNLDPYMYGTDENGNLQFDIDKVIENYQEQLKTAPDKPKKVEVKPALNLEYETEKGKEIDESHFEGVAETEHGNYHYVFTNALKPDLSFRITKIRDDLPDPMGSTNWTEGKFLSEDEESENYLPEEMIKDKIGISFEEAKKTAQEKVDKLGLGLSLADWDYSVFYQGETGASKEGMLDAGYLFCFARELDGVPVTYTISMGGGLPDMDSTLEPWSYEICNIIVGDDGIESMELMSPYQMGGVVTENVQLLDFNSIINIYEQMMEVSNADIVNYEAQRTFHIRTIKFGYSRIYDPAADNDTGLMVPVWDFFGGFEYVALDGEVSERNSGERSSQSFLTINAIDGTVIDRGLGY